MMRGLLVVCIALTLIAAALAAPYLPYPARYCAKHPNNESCAAYADRVR